MKKKLLFCNPVTLLFLGAAPALSASTDVRAALGMSAAVLCVLLCSALVLGLLRKLIPAEAWRSSCCRPSCPPPGRCSASMPQSSVWI